jgi:hypothetical protein
MPSSLPSERRHPLVSVATLRRDLREADHDRFTMKASAAPWAAARPRFRRGPVVLGLFVSAAVATAVWAARPPAVPAPDREVRVQITPVSAHRVTAEQSAVLTADRRQTTSTTLGRGAEHRELRVRRASAERRPITSTAKVRPTPTRRAGPRPLSPGEFGRPRANTE